MNDNPASGRPVALLAEWRERAELVATLARALGELARAMEAGDELGIAAMSGAARQLRALDVAELLTLPPHVALPLLRDLRHQIRAMQAELEG